jgi:hypothetical protein
VRLRLICLTTGREGKSAFTILTGCSFESRLAVWQQKVQDTLQMATSDGRV